MFVRAVGSFSPGEILVLNITRYRSAVVNTLYTMLATLWYFARYRFDTVYFTPSRSRAGFVKDIPLILLGRWSGKRMIAHLHGANFRSFYESDRLLQPLIRYGYRRLDTGIVLLEEMRGEFHHFPELKVKVVPNCYDPVLDDEEKSRGYHSADEMVTKNPEQILYLSALMHSKGILEFLDAAAMVLEKRSSATVVVAGAPGADGSMGVKEITREFAKRLVLLQQRFPGRISYPGLVTGQTKTDLLKSSSLFVFPSWHPSEALPVSILEAMRTGSAIVASRHNFLPCIIGPENGIIVEPRSAASIAGAVISLLENREQLRKIGKHNAGHAVNNYAPGRYGDSISRIVRNN